jgi:RND family efflux transporter MFP subunit
MGTVVINMTANEVSEQIKEPNTNFSPGPGPHTSSQRRWLVALIILLIVGGVLYWGIRSRLNDEAKLRTVVAQTAAPSVSVILPKPGTPAQEIILPGNVQPFISSPIYARTDGYLKKWYFDIGAHVKEGQLLAVIQSPEVDQQLEQARSTLATAQANLELSEITRTRYVGLFAKHAVSQQDRDNAVGTYNANKAVVDADKANVERYAAMVGFEKIYAPFDGVITARNTDIGDLINSGNSGVPKTDLFHLAQTDTLRVYVNVPEEFSRGINPSRTEADIVLAEFPGRKFPGKLVRTSEAINMTTRTLLVEVDVSNPTATLFSGSYAEVHLKIPGQSPTYLVPSNTLLFRTQDLQVGVVQDGKAVLKNIIPGHDFGNEIEVINGLSDRDQVIVNPSDSLVSGQAVHVVNATLPGDNPQ